MVGKGFLEKLREDIGYNPETGKLTWKVSKPGNKRVGSLVGSLRKDGYIHVTYCKRLYYAHRLIWFLVYGVLPVNYIDHINGNRNDNRLSNLRDVTRQENMHNQRNKSKNNKSGYRGVSRNSASGKWVAQIEINNEGKYLGLFLTAEEASEAYEAAKLIYHPTAPI